MEGLSASKNVYSGLKAYWRRKRKGYERLNGAGRRRKNRVEYLSTEGRSACKRGRFWKINLRPRLKLKVKRFSPKKLLLNMRDAYVNMMLKIANSRVMSSGGLTGDYGVSGFGMRQFKEYDEKMIVEIYKSMVMAQGQLVPPPPAAAATKSGTEIMCQP